MNLMPIIYQYGMNYIININVIQIIIQLKLVILSYQITKIGINYWRWNKFLRVLLFLQKI